MVRRTIKPTSLWDRWKAVRPRVSPDVSVERCQDGVRLEAPAAKRKGFLGMLARSVDASQTKSYELEPVGSFVFELIDGQRSVESIARTLQKHFKMSRIESETATAAFFQMLIERGLIQVEAKK